MQYRNYRIIIGGGGTGGHIFPAISIANALKRKHRNIEILFVGSKDKMEMKKVPQAGYPIEGLWISGLQRKITFKNLLFPIKLIFSIIKSVKIINRYKPDLVVGVGGYASGAILYVASKKGIPTLIQEQNSYAGITNKILSKYVDRICVAYNDMDKYFPKSKILFTGNPISKEIQDLTNKKEEAYTFFNFNQGKKVVLVIGGSLGARTINECIFNNLDKLENENIFLIWQTGEPFYKTAVNKVENSSYRFVKVFDFINRMDLAYAISDIVISRAGALAISELCITGKASILVPSPNVAEDHQTKNAMALVEEDAAILVKDIEAKDKLIDTIKILIIDEEKMRFLEKNIKKLAVHNSDDKIADEITELIKK